MRELKSAQIANVLGRTLSPSTIDSSSLELERMRGVQGFAVKLLIICDSLDYDPAIRQSALIYLKNTIQDHCQRNNCIPPKDLQAIKNSLLQAMIRNVTNKQLAPTLRQIIYQMAEKYYPREWPVVVDHALKKLENATDFNEILGCVEALRAVLSVFGGSVVKEIELSNLCNKIMLPLFGLTSKLLQNFSADITVILMSVFKLFSSAIQFYLPAIMQANIHNLMIFVKKILDLNIILDDTHSFIYHLKRINLRILFRIYQRHANQKLTAYRQFAIQFHAKYTRSFVETLVYQVLSDGGNQKSTRHRHMEIMKMALSCLAYINRQSHEAAVLLMQHRDSLINLCLQKTKLNFNRNYQNFVDFKLHVHENRVQLKEFFFSLMRCEAMPDQQTNAVTSLLGLLLNCLQNGEAELKELALYIFSEMSAQVQFLSTPLEDNMIQLIVSYIKPLLKEDQNLLVRMRACQLLASYNYLQLPEDHIKEIATSIYNCLLVGNSEKEVFLKIYACNAFNSVLKYTSIVEFIKPHLQDILRIYTSLLEADVSIIKNFQDLLNLLQDEIAPFANDLVQILIGLFHTYSKQNGSSEQPQVYGGNGDGDQDDDDDDSTCEEDDSNNQSIAKACISSIRQILQAEKTILNIGVREELFGIVVNIFGDQSQLFIQEGYNILNLLLYKLTTPVEEKHYIFFKVIAYAILGLPNNLINELRHGSEFDRQYAQILQNICAEPDNDLVENCIGCLRNFIAKSRPEVLCGFRDQVGTTLMENIFRIVKFVHENGSQKSSQTDRLIVLTLYITLIEYQVIDQHQLGEILAQVLAWMQMEQEAIQLQGGLINPGRYVYTSVYLQILMLAVHFYGQIALRQFNINTILQRVLFLQDNFKCDYEIGRVMIGLADLLERQAVTESGVAGAVMEALPELVRRICKLRQEGDNELNDLEVDDEAEEDRLMGNDENSMMIGWQQGRPTPTEKDLQLQEDEEEDNDWEEEFNKFYDSPFDKIDEIKWLENVLKGPANTYCSLMSQGKQDELALYFANAPPKDQ